MFNRYEQQVGSLLQKIQGQYEVYPDYTVSGADGYYSWHTDVTWTSGFFPGLLWLMSNHTANRTYAEYAQLWTAGRAVEAHDNTTHDVGFMVFYSFGKGLLLDPSLSNASYYTQILLETAQSLSERYNPIVGMTRSWGSIDDLSEFEVIIDNLMNLELLFWAAANGGGEEYLDMAISHVDHTFQHWVRADSSTAHLCVFNPNTSALLTPCTGTPQGLSANSTWARGQAWGIYGFTMAYRYTGLERFLSYAENVTTYWLLNVPSDQIPKWDFDAQPPNDERDTSAAAIAASAFLELYKFTNNVTYYNEATAILTSLFTTYLGVPEETEAVLTYCFHDCGSNNCTIIESDYYFYEALRRFVGEWP